MIPVDLAISICLIKCSISILEKAASLNLALSCSVALPCGAVSEGGRSDRALTVCFYSYDLLHLIPSFRGGLRFIKGVPVLRNVVNKSLLVIIFI